MSERKVINKYYPPDYDPIKAEQALKKASKKLKTNQRDVVTIRLMTPFSIRCSRCSEYIAKSRKFNGKKESLQEKYLDTFKIFRLSIKCPRCNNMIAFRTDPKTADFVMEYGGVRNYVSKSTNGASESPKVETIDETLERLVSEHNDEEHRNITGNSGEDRMELLEQRLSKLQREQEDAEELERLKKARTLQLRKESLLRNEKNKQQQNGNIDDMELEKIAEQAFSAKGGISHTKGSLLAPKREIKSVRKLRRPTGLLKDDQNPLGVRIKRK
ncbi:YJU2 (YKL095W) [Zygosaccharomyces parabailii]|nr:YJU2 (YKL095W) [Zygosaccharomyces parabailii]CDH12082.1 related to YJU2-Essential nuclear protein,putative spliceosomal component involved in mRNA splicing [Zygosaccharomyces bailii ISA1307]